MEEKTGCSTLKRDGNIIGINREGKKRPRRQRGAGWKKLCTHVRTV